jgi:hypothetical protein
LVRARNQMGAKKTAETKSKQRRQEVKVVINLLTVSTVFWVVMSTYLVTWVIYFYHEFTGYAHITEDGKTLIVDLALFIYATPIFNYSVNFIIYCYNLPFYREDLKRLFRCLPPEY